MTDHAEPLTARGQDRRRALIEATLRIIVRDGPAAVTHRSVAREAGATHGSVTYYFGSRRDLLGQALEEVARQNVAWLAGAQERLLACAPDPHQFALTLADLVHAQLIKDRAMGVSVLELHLAAARDPTLRPLIYDWGAAYARASAAGLETLGSTNPARDTLFITQLINGMVLEQLAVQRTRFRREVLEPTLVRAVRLIAAGGAG